MAYVPYGLDPLIVPIAQRVGTGVGVEIQVVKIVGAGGPKGVF